MNRRRESSVRNLQFLYSIFVALAFERVIVTIVEPERESLPIVWDTVPLGLAFLVTVVPFYHGALRHLDDSYVEGGSQELKSPALLMDFIVLFLESALIYTIALHIDQPARFGFFLVALLAVDALWGAFIRESLMIQKQPRPELMWAKINGIALAVVIVFLLINGLWIESMMVLAWALLVVCIARSVVDYFTSWDFYFPDD